MSRSLIAARLGICSGHRVHHVFGLWVFAALFVSCASSSPETNHAELLRRSTLQFHSDIRWQRYDSAAAHLPLDQRDTFLDFYEARRQALFVTEFEVIQLQLSPDKKTAHAQVLMSWYELPSTQVRTSLIDERWAFQEQQNRWEVVEQQVELVQGPVKAAHAEALR